MRRDPFVTVACVLCAAVGLALWSSACSSDSSPTAGGGTGGQLSANPPSVSVAVNTNTTVNISGGVGTYAVQAQPDTTIARIVSLITNTVGSPPVPVGTLTIRGVSADSVGTATTIRDGSGPSKTVAVPIRVTP